MGSPTARLLWPNEAQTAMLRGCRWTLPDAAAAWSAWEERFGGPGAVLSAGPDGPKRLLPILAEAQRRIDRPLPPVVQTCLRSAAVRESLRCRTYRPIVARACTSLNDHAVPFIVAKGAALADTAYPSPDLRHCHDCDLLVERADLPRAIEALTVGGFSLFGRSQCPGTGGATMVDPSGLPIQLHHSLFRIPWYRPPQRAMWQRGCAAEICGVPARTLNPADTLLHVCGNAACSGSRDTLVWACDSWMCIERFPDLDFDQLAETAIEGRLALPVGAMLRYLGDSLSLPIPESVVSRLETAAAKTPITGREACLFGITTGKRGRLGSVIGRSRSPRDAIALLKWMFAPAPDHLRFAYNLQRDRQLPWHYLKRPLRGLLRRQMAIADVREPPAPPDVLVEAGLVGDAPATTAHRPSRSRPPKPGTEEGDDSKSLNEEGDHSRNVQTARRQLAVAPLPPGEGGEPQRAG